MEDNVDKNIIAQKKDQSTYLLSKNLEIRLWYYCLTHTSNARIVQASKLDNKIKLLDVDIKNFKNDWFSSNLDQ